MPEIRKADANMERELRGLWKLLYPEDSEEYIDLFFRRRFVPEETAVVTGGEEILGVMYLLPCKLQDGKKAYYAYAGGIRPECRGRGYFRLLVERLVRECEARNAALFLVPGEGLWAFYRSMGLSRTFRRKSLSLTAGKTEAAVEILPCSPEEYAGERRRLLGPESPVWDIPALQYAAEEAAFGGGGMVRITGGGIDGAALVTKREEDVLLQETTLTAAELRLAAGALCRAFGRKKLTAHLPVEAERGEKEEAGLMSGAGDSPGHLALTLVY